MTGAAIKAFRAQKQMSQYQLAQLVGTTQNAVSKWERDKLGRQAYTKPNWSGSCTPLRKNWMPGGTKSDKNRRKSGANGTAQTP